MARARSIKPAFFTNEQLAEVHPLGRLLFAGLWTLADREGRLADRPRRIKAEVLPYDDADADALLDDLQKRDFIIRYAVAGERYIQIISFGKHQNPHIKEQASAIPAWGGKVAAPEIPALAPEIPALAGLTPSSLTPSSLTPDSIYGLRPDVWAAWRKHRGAKLTAQAVKLQTTKLNDLARSGHDPNAVILQSIERGWSGLFPLKPDEAPRTAKHDRRDQVAGEIWTGVPNAKRPDENAIDGTAERVA